MKVFTYIFNAILSYIHWVCTGDEFVFFQNLYIEKCQYTDLSFTRHKMFIVGKGGKSSKVQIQIALNACLLFVQGLSIV